MVSWRILINDLFSRPVLWLKYNNELGKWVMFNTAKKNLMASFLLLSFCLSFCSFILFILSLFRGFIRSFILSIFLSSLNYFNKQQNHNYTQKGEPKTITHSPTLLNPLTNTALWYFSNFFRRWLMEALVFWFFFSKVNLTALLERKNHLRGINSWW